MQSGPSRPGLDVTRLKTDMKAADVDALIKRN